ncbi:SLAC1 anion channel family protein [Octadecabacter sp. R77987]|uniref:SLAC1 anion channel family protein n=1 Tax=Octadecabacter sp. R77987 TaxID=3093874 RepID=UPI00366E4910
MSESQRLAHFPITFFAVVMGLLGLALALHATAPMVPLAGTVAPFALILAMAVFAVIAVFYVVKWMRHPAAVHGEWNHPVKLAFFPTVSISLLLLAVALREGSTMLATAFWIAGAALQGGLTLAVVSNWISHRSFQVGHLTPAWFIPAVGNVIVPIAGVSLGFPELSWLFFSTGIMFWVVLLTLVMNRLMFHDPIPARLFPTMMILIAPPAVGFVGYIALVGQVDPFARILMNLGYLFAALMVVQVPKILRLPFALSFWALSFPLAALSIAAARYGALTGVAAHQWIGAVVCGVLVITVAGLILRTVRAIMRGEICQPE